MGFGVYRRRPDYGRRRRVLPLAVAAAAVVGPTLFVRPQLPQREKPRFEYYQRRQLLPPTLAGGGPPAGPPPNLRQHRPPLPDAFRRPWDYRLHARLPFGVTAAVPDVGPILRGKLPPHPQEPPWDYRRKQSLPTSVAAAAPGVGPTLRPSTQAQPRVFERPFDYRLRQRLPTVPTAPIIIGGPTLRQKPPLMVHAFVRPWDYGSFTGRKVVKPRLPATAVTAGAEYASRGHYDQGRGLYHTPVVETGEPYFSGAITGAQSIPDATETVVAMVPQASKDPWGLFDAGNSSIVIKYPGTYLYGAQVVWSADAVGIREIVIKQYSSLNVLISKEVTGRVNAVSAGDTAQSVVRLSPVQAAIGSYFRMEVTQTSGGNLDLDGGLMWMVRIGPIDLILPT